MYVCMYVFMFYSSSLFPKTGHSFQQIWTKFGMQPPHNLQMVIREFLERNHANHATMLWTCSFRMLHAVAEAAAAT